MSLTIHLKRVIISLIIFIFSVSLFGQSSTLNGKKYYVWDFSTRDASLNELTEWYTEAFEEALIQTRVGTALERRDYVKLLRQKEGEKEITSLESISASKLDILKTLEADIVIFGELRDDIEGGQVIVSASIQSFDSKKLDKVSIFIPRGKRLDPESRQYSMNELAGKLVPESVNKSAESSTEEDLAAKKEEKKKPSWWERAKNKVLDTAQNTLLDEADKRIGESGPMKKVNEVVPGTTLENYSAERFNIRINLKSYKLSNRTLTMYFTVTNLGGDRTFYIHDDSKLFDNDGFEYKVEYSEIAGKPNKWGVSATELLQYVTVEAKIIYNNISTSATSIALFEPHFEVYREGHFNPQFRDIELTESLSFKK